MDAPIEIELSGVQFNRVGHSQRSLAVTVPLLFLLLAPGTLLAQEISLSGRVVDPAGNALPNAAVEIVGEDQVLAYAISAPDGQFAVRLRSSGEFVLKAEASGFRPVVHPITVRQSGNSAIEIRMGQLSSRIENVAVTADVNETDVLSPDPGEKVFVRQDLLDANPGRPGAAVSIPGYPIETASSGIKAPQYFAPGVAGDHGEPIAQYIAVGSYLVPNNLSANAHGNGYSDPNIFIPEILETVQIDGGAFNVREGNHSVNLAATYGLRSHIDPFITLTGDYRDIDMVAGLSPNPDSW
ncbi:MAG: carboxypeptidase-like regulatory domain-containing protein, partial [Candidatus Sulfotelmatobacter sp.]